MDRLQRERWWIRIRIQEHDATLLAALYAELAIVDAFESECAFE